VHFRVADSDVVRAGDPLLAEITDIKSGTVWLKRIVSQGCAPAVVEMVGGSMPDVPRKRLPPTALPAIYAEIVRLWDEDQFARFALMGAGFSHRPLRPYQPGKAPNSSENLAVRARWVHRSPFGIEGTSDTERDAYKRARRGGIVAHGEFTPYGSSLLEVVDEAKDRIVQELGAGDCTRWALDSRVERDFTENVIEAAIDDLVADRRVARVDVRCQHCGEPHDGLRLA
jgi:hypothetical protein